MRGELSALIFLKVSDEVSELTFLTVSDEVRKLTKNVSGQWSVFSNSTPIYVGSEHHFFRTRL